MNCQQGKVMDIFTDDQKTQQNKAAHKTTVSLERFRTKGEKNHLSRVQYKTNV